MSSKDYPSYYSHNNKDNNRDDQYQLSSTHDKGKRSSCYSDKNHLSSSSSPYPSASSSHTSPSLYDNDRYLPSSSHGDSNYQPPVPGQGKHYAPEGTTRAIYRGDDGKRIDNYLKTRDTKYIETARAGDFHTSNQRAAYFTFDKNYARGLAPAGGKILRKDVPREMLRQQHKFDDEPSEDWRHLVERSRKDLKADGQMRRVQKKDIIEGPVAHTSTQSIARSPSPIPMEKLKPRKRGDEYVQQIVFKGDALDRLRGVQARESPPGSTFSSGK